MNKFYSKDEVVNKLRKIQTSDVLHTYQSLPETLQEDFDVLDVALSRDTRVFGSLKKDLQENKQVVLMALQYYCFFYADLNENLKKDLEINKALLASDGSYLKEMSTEIKDDFDLVSLAVSSEGYALEYASERLRNNIDIVSKAFTNKILSIYFIGTQFLDHPEEIIQLNFAGFLTVSMQNIKPDPNDFQYIALTKINNALMLNKDQDFIENIKNIFMDTTNFEVSGWKDFISTLDQNLRKFQPDGFKVNNTLNFYFSYLLPHWSLNTIQKLDKDLNQNMNDINNPDLKSIFHTIFEKEYTRRHIVDIHQANKIKKKNSKTRKINF
jgi:hypothetical protein